MSQSPRISIVFKTTFKPNGSYYYGSHSTSDISFGTEQWSDPFVGTGTKIKQLVESVGNRRDLFHVQAIRIGTPKDCEDHLKRILSTLDLTDPKCLNSKEGVPLGHKQSPEHLENRAAALVGNENAAGQLDAGTDVDFDGPAGSKLKWFNNGEQQKLIVCVNDVPIKEEYRSGGWVIGKLHKNPHVAKRLNAIKNERKEEESKEDV